MGKEDKSKEREQARESQTETQREENVTEVRPEK